jgi:Xaa-Pro aminopeptidase
MFEKDIYSERRKKLRESFKSGVILFLGNNESPMNYPGNPYPFRQDSSFLYFFGLDKPGFIGLIDIDEGKDYMFGLDFSVDDIIWMGPQPTVRELAQEVGVSNTGTPVQLNEQINGLITAGRKIHYLPPYRADTVLQLEKMLGISNTCVNNYASLELIQAVVALRSVKSEVEIEQIEEALKISSEMYKIVMEMARPGIYEREICGRIEGVVSSAGNYISFPVILSINGETLHNHYHGNLLKKNDLLVVDSGAQSPEYYASDITRTFPVGGSFTPEQRDIYQIVLDSQLAAIKSMKPGATYREIHLQTASIIASGLKEMGLMKGSLEAAVSQGAHALFFPHGLGHMMGLDVHDMENLGEDYVGYDDTIQRSSQFGLAYLRLAKELHPGFVVTVEPGIYFIPALIDQWKAENKLKDFINYEKVESFKNFGGIRIEDDVLITNNGRRVLGEPIPKEINEIEEIME